MRLLENYVSTQGEGPNTGEVVRFLRFAGCNLRCPGWPCDTQHAIEPSLYNGKFRNVEPIELIAELPEYPNRMCITGGEPFLQKDMEYFIDSLLGFNYSVDVFTNGTFYLPAYDRLDMTYIMDWKLTGSGEADKGLSTRTNNIRRLQPTDAIKFVVKHFGDLHEAFDVYKEFRAMTVAQWWVGAAWGHIDDATIVDFVTNYELPWHLNVQMHKHVWDPDAKLV